MRDLLAHPLWRPEDLGLPIPDSPHAVSVCLPTWRDNVGYEEQEPRVMAALQSGYPRFVYHPLARQLFAECARRWGRPGEGCLVFPSARVAASFAAYLRRRADAPVRTQALPVNGAVAAFFPESQTALAKSFWQHAGLGISSRLAAACLAGETLGDGAAAKQEIRARLAAAAGIAPTDVVLFPSGMTAIHLAHRVLQRLRPHRRTVQFGFPYVDTLKVQEVFGTGVEFYPGADAGDLAALGRLLAGEPLGGVFCEFPSNPLLVSPDLERLAALCRSHGVPLLVDETLATLVNAELLPVADVICTSLTKYFSGIGDVIGGALLLNPHSPFYADFQTGLATEYEDLLAAPDAAALAVNSRGFVERVRAINRNGAALAAHLHGHPKVEHLYYPDFVTADAYRRCCRPGAGGSGLLSIVLRDPAAHTARFFDALPCNKGPNLGMDYTLVCPFTLLAHYRELDFAERCGVSRYLVRVAVGREPLGELIARFDAALADV